MIKYKTNTIRKDIFRSAVLFSPHPNSTFRFFSVYSIAETQLNPLWITGFTDAEGCFTIIVSKLPSQKYKITTSFEINLHLKDSLILYKIQSFFKVGHINIRKDKHLAVYRVTKRTDLINTIIPFFQQFPLLTAKYNDYILWKDVVHLMENGAHKTEDGFNLILSSYASINRGTKGKKVLTSFPYLIPTVKEKTPSLPLQLNPYWVSGFVAGDGGFHVNLRKKDETKVDYSFSITQHNKDLKLMNLFIDFFKCGSVLNREKYKRCDYTVQDKNNLLMNIIPHFNKFSLQNLKELDFIEFKEIMLIISNKNHLKEEGLNKIKELIQNTKKRRDSNYEGIKE